jgi:hypothetical protein
MSRIRRTPKALLLARPRVERATPAALIGGIIELGLSLTGLVLLRGDLGDVAQPEVIAAAVLAGAGGAVAIYTWVVAARHRLWGPAVDPWPIVGVDLLLLGLAIAAVGLMAALHPAFGLIAVQGLLASMFLGSIRRSPVAAGCLPVMAVLYGGLLVVLGVFLYRELQADSTRDLPLGLTAIFTLVMPGVRTALMAVPRQV